MDSTSIRHRLENVSVLPDPCESLKMIHSYISHNESTLRRRITVLVCKQSYGLSRGQQLQLAEDIVNETYVRALRNAKHFHFARDAGSWIMGIAWNLIRDYWRGRKRRPTPITGSQIDPSDDGDMLDKLIGGGEDPLRRLELGEDLARLRDEMNRLAPQDRKVLEWRYLQEHEYSEVAEALGVSPGTARVRVCRALDRLSTAMAS